MLQLQHLRMRSLARRDGTVHRAWCTSEKKLTANSSLAKEMEEAKKMNNCGVSEGIAI